MRVYFSTCRFVGFCCPVIQVHLMPCPSAGPKLFWTGSKMFGLDPKVEKSLMPVYFSMCQFVGFCCPAIQVHTFDSLSICRAKTILDSPIFLAELKTWKKVLNECHFLVQSKNIWTREKVQIFFWAYRRMGHE